MVHRAVLAVLAASVGCLGTSSTQCPSTQLTCPSGMICSPDGQSCVSPDQLEACESDLPGQALDDGAECAFGGRRGTCLGGVCVAFVCGNGIVEDNEACEPSMPQSCIELDYDRGRSTCAADTCATDARTCGRIGWIRRPFGSYSSTGIDALGPDFAVSVGIEAGLPTEIGIGWGVRVLRGDASWEQLDTSAFPLEGLSQLPILYGVEVVSETEIYAAGTNGIVGRYDGTSWTVDRLVDSGDRPLGLRSLARSPVGTRVLAGGVGAATAELKDGTWTIKELPDFAANWSLQDLLWVGPNTAYGVGSTGVVLGSRAGLLYRYEVVDGTGSWSVVRSESDDIPQLYALAESSSYVLAAGRNGYLLELQGESWVEVDFGLGSQDWRAGDGAGDHLWLVGQEGDVGRVAYHDGETWHLSNSEVRLANALSATPGFAMISTLEASYSHSGQDWALASTVRGSSNLFALSAEAAFSVVPKFAVLGKVLRKTADDFEELPNSPSAPNDLWGRTNGSSLELYLIDVSGDYPEIIGWDGESASWPTVATLDAQVLVDAIYGDDSHLYVVGNSGLFVVLGPHGEDPQTLSPVTEAHLRDAWAEGGTAIAVGRQGTVLRYRNSTLEALPIPTDANLYAVWGTSPEDFYVGGAQRTLLHYQNGGFTAAALPPVREELSLDPAVVTITGISGTGPSDVYVVDDGGLIHHFDGGGWGEVRSQVGRIADVFALPGVVYLIGDGAVQRLLRAF